ncbi:hypothetical protein DP113_33840 (plasmid) [Brasilonema octagenarum UFV-E1]|uniref:Uncharacterized protein n=3 Tax=Scytonemataceae TaxID=1182 RepID=A0A856MMP6_9CYAN|nr:hypothetical protein [Brasilonema octagenarum UFV-OR1]QDL12703.1 hypothetical protein DP114_33730 [Brasilonema sennae CENA114]QDL19098.1 hypothetical protein DP113_33840 [Brasilonema octagenarum UFV-E1]
MNRFNPSLLEKLEWENKKISKNNIRTTPISQGEKLGGEFHLIMQQIGLGLPVELFLKAYPQIDKWVEVAKPFLDIPGSKQWNTEAQYLYKSQLLYANYDLIIYQEKQVIGLDWTIQKTSNFQLLENSFHTQLRLFLLHERTQLSASEISLVYLFVNTGDVYQFTYSKEKHQAFKERLEATLLPFLAEVEDFPKQTSSSCTLTPQEAHDKWLAKEISAEEYLAAIPEVEL